MGLFHHDHEAADAEAHNEVYGTTHVTEEHKAKCAPRFCPLLRGRSLTSVLGCSRCQVESRGELQIQSQRIGIYSSLMSPSSSEAPPRSLLPRCVDVLGGGAWWDGR